MSDSLFIGSGYLTVIKEEKAQIRKDRQASTTSPEVSEPADARSQPTYFGIVALSGRFVLRDPQAELEAARVVEGGHGHAPADELREAVRDLGYHGDVVSLVVVGDPGTVGDCGVKRAPVMACISTGTVPRNCPGVPSGFLISACGSTNTVVS